MKVALLTKQSLEAQGYDVSLLEGDAAANGAGPLRPDAYVTIRAAPGANAATGVEAWFCQVEGSLGSQLADLLLRSLAASGLPNVGQGDGDIADPEAFDCGLLLAGRARMPTVLLEVPAFTAGDSEGQALAQGLADGIHQFFQKYRTSLLQEDQRRRLVWPALGPITSYFGPSHPLGIDIGQSEGSIVAATDGVVVFAGGNPCCSYGLYVVVDSTEGIITLYAHLESISRGRGAKGAAGAAPGRRRVHGPLHRHPPPLRGHRQRRAPGPPLLPAVATSSASAWRGARDPVYDHPLPATSHGLTWSSSGTR